jgi:hypothetical protein
MLDVGGTIGDGITKHVMILMDVVVAEHHHRPPWSSPLATVSRLEPRGLPRPCLVRPVHTSARRGATGHGIDREYGGRRQARSQPFLLLMLLHGHLEEGKRRGGT